MIHYGVPDVSLFFPRNHADQERLAAISLGPSQPLSRVCNRYGSTWRTSPRTKGLCGPRRCRLSRVGDGAGPRFEVLIQSKSGANEDHKRDEPRRRESPGNSRPDPFSTVTTTEWEPVGAAPALTSPRRDRAGSSGDRERHYGPDGYGQPPGVARRSSRSRSQKLRRPSGEGPARADPEPGRPGARRKINKRGSLCGGKPI